MESNHMTCYALSSRGGREANEDSVAVARSPFAALCVLADGLGGHGMGDVSSQLVCRHIKEVFGKWQGADMERFLRDSFDSAQICLTLEQVRLKAQDRMKTTAVAVVADGAQVGWAPVGDSRLYYFKDGSLVGRTLDHSVPQKLATAGEIQECQIRGHEKRNQLYRVMGKPWKKPAYVLGGPIPFEDNQVFLLCSDGFWEYILEEQMEELLRRSETPKEWILAMEQEVLKNGAGKNMDNYSAVALFTNHCSRELSENRLQKSEWREDKAESEILP